MSFIEANDDDARKALLIASPLFLPGNFPPLSRNALIYLGYSGAEAAD